MAELRSENVGYSEDDVEGYEADDERLPTTKDSRRWRPGWMMGGR